MRMIVVFMLQHTRPELIVYLVHYRVISSYQCCKVLTAAVMNNAVTIAVQILSLNLSVVCTAYS